MNGRTVAVVAVLALGVLTGGCRSGKSPTPGAASRPSTRAAGAKVEPPRQRPPMALRFDGARRACVTARSVAFDRYPAFTVEAWVRDWRGAILCQGMAGDPENSLWLSTGNTADRGVPHESCGWEGGTGQNYEAVVGYGEPGRWNHVAMVYDGRRQSVFLNGRTVSIREVPAPGPLDPTRPFIVGAHQYGGPRDKWTYGTGVLGPVRVSVVARYSGDFTPAERWEPDDQALLLYDLTEGTGDLLADRSGCGREGRIDGATWQERPADGGPTTQPAGGHRPG